MARLKARSIDRNRLCKRYPFVRAPKRMTFMSDQDVIIELLTLEYDNEDTKRGTFDIPYDDTEFRVAISPRDTGTDSANVNLYVDTALTDTAGVTIEASAPFTGIVDVIIIRIGS
mgnify:CR=1 FL=1